jgi:pyrroloquinoline quinone biosynthesis protein B
VKLNLLLLLVLFLGSSKYPINNSGAITENKNSIETISQTSLVVLGTVQDGGSPHIGCKKNCCKELFTHPAQHRNVVSLGIIDPQHQKKFIVECTPDFPVQAKQLLRYASFNNIEMPDGIFLTHAHIGHYSGLMYLGKEAVNADKVNVYAMPRMKQFLETNGPWSQLVNNKNILLNPLLNNQRVIITANISITPLVVPHRDEYSETVGFIIEGPAKNVLFIPDIDKWQKWDKDIIKMIATVDFALIDGTFYDAAEINNRDIATIRHPFIIESMELFKNLSPQEKNKIYFIHFNHTNGVLHVQSKQSKTVLANGFHIAQINQIIKL